MADTSALRFAVLQLGARNHYAAPAALARAGLLRRLYTDLCADVAPARQLRALWPPALRPRPVQRMFGRRLPAGLPPGLVRGAPLTLIGQELATLAGLRRSPVDAGGAVAALARR